MDTAADQCMCGGPAWHVLNETGEKIRCNGYLKGKHVLNGPLLPLVSAITCVQVENEELFLLLVNQICYYNDPNQDESLCLPYQAEKHGVTFSLIPRDRVNTIRTIGHLKFNGRKMYIDIRLPSEEEINTLEVYELTSPEPFNSEQESFD